MNIITDPEAALEFYSRDLLDNTIPFWFPRSVDREHGGFLTAFDRDGSLVQGDKSVWAQGRMVWMLSTLYNTVDKSDAWLEMAQHGMAFLEKHGFDSDGRMFFLLTQDGSPLRKRRYIFSEIFAVIAMAAYGNATEDDSYRQYYHHHSL